MGETEVRLTRILQVLVHPGSEQPPRLQEMVGALEAWVTGRHIRFFATKLGI